MGLIGSILAEVIKDVVTAPIVIVKEVIKEIDKAV
jgi:hypothetical protein